MHDESADGLAPGAIVDGAYEIRRLLARTLLGSVWVARRVKFPDKQVAIKVLRDARYLQREAKILAALEHPNIVQVFDSGVLPNGLPYLVMELLHGETLKQRLERGRIPVTVALNIVEQVGGGLIAAHAKRVVHCDLKPNNIFLCQVAAAIPLHEHVKILDFGISSVLGNETQCGDNLAGTPQYMAPEQHLHGRSAADERSDVFSFGAVVYEMLSGKAPFFHDNMSSAAMQAVYMPAQPLLNVAPGVSPALATVVDRAMAKDPEQRFVSVAAFVETLRRAQAISGWNGETLPRKRSRPWRGAVVAAALLLLAIAAGSLWQALFSFPVAGGPDTVAVMDFENTRRDKANDWYRKVLLNAFNTELSNVPQLSVIAPELIRRTANEAGLDAMAAARRLGVQRFITGSFAVVGDIIRIDARLVNTSRGLQEAAENVEGAPGQFFELQRRLTVALLGHLVPNAKAPQSSVSGPAHARMEKYRQMLAAEGIATNQEAPAKDPEPTSRLAVPSVMDLACLFESTAYAADIAPDTAAAVQTVLEAYRVAHERGDVDGLASLYVSFPAAQREAVTDYSKNVAQLKVELSNVKIQPRERDILVSYTRRDRFIDKESGEPMALEVQLTRFLVRDGSELKFVAEE